MVRRKVGSIPKARCASDTCGIVPKGSTGRFSRLDLAGTVFCLLLSLPCEMHH